MEHTDTNIDTDTQTSLKPKKKLNIRMVKI